MSLVNLHLSTGKKEIIISIIPNNTNLGKKWFEEVKYCVDNFGGSIDRGNETRIYNLSQVTEEEYKENLNILIDRINASKKVFDKISSPLSQNMMNHLHHEFELYTFFSQEEKSQYSDDSCRAFEELNLLIHSWESQGWIPRIIASIHRDRVFPLKNSDYENWTTTWEPGDVVLNYCLTGKKIIDIWKDKDDVVGEENIRPQHLYSASFQVFFGPGYFTNKDYEIQFNKWWDENREKLSYLGFEKGDPKNAIGEGIVGKLQDSVTEVFEAIQDAKYISRVSYEG